MYVYGKKTKIGKVSVELHLGAFRLRFTHPKGQRHETRLPNESDEAYNHAIKKARQINTDIENDCFDFDYIRYKPELAKNLAIAPQKQKQKNNLKDLWE